MSEPPVFTAQAGESVWAVPDARPRGGKPVEISWHHSIVNKNDREHQSLTVLLPRMDDEEVAAFDEAALSRLGEENGHMRRTPGPSMHAAGEGLSMRALTPAETDGYNAWSGANFMSGIINRSSILESPLKFGGGRSSSTPVSLGDVAPGARAAVTPKRSESPGQMPPSPGGRRGFPADPAFNMKESRFVEDVIKSLSSVQEADEELEAATGGARRREVEAALAALRLGLLGAHPADSTSCSSEAQNSYERDKEPTDGPDRPMSPETKVACKDFVREFRRLERLSATEAQRFAQGQLRRIAAGARWRVHLQLADLSKRLNQEDEAAQHYQLACELEPTASKGWLEWSKMQDECGNTETALQTVLKGIVARSTSEHGGRFDEVLLLRALRLYEKQSRLGDARRLIYSVCKDQCSVERVWRVLFEGAQMEARAGNSGRARLLYEFLMTHVPWYGPIYSEAFRLEETGRHDARCLHIIRRGLLELHRYGPLWFGLLRLMERMDFEAGRRAWATQGDAPQLPNVRFYLALAAKNISRELVWKLHFEMGQIEERAVGIAAQGRAWAAGRAPCGEQSSRLGAAGEESGRLAGLRDALLGPARRAYVESLLSCPSNLRWKVLLAGARMELSAGRRAVSRELLSEAMSVVPAKSRAHVQLECARLEEFLDNFGVAREILLLGRGDVPSEWKISLELALQEARAQRLPAAVEILVGAVDYHSNAGRLWALLIQLLSSAWRADSWAVKHSLWSLFEKTNFFSDYYKCICPQEHGDQLNGSFESVLKSSVESAGVTDTETSFESAHSLKESIKDQMLSRVPRVPLLGSMRQMRAVRRLALRLALEEVPKSGECWCEAARRALNPMEAASEFDLAVAHRSLAYAVLFTPQYGDSFIERIRLELLCQIILPDVLCSLGVSLPCFYEAIFRCDVQDADADMRQRFGSPVAAAEYAKTGISAARLRRARRSRVEALYKMNSKIGYSGGDFRQVVLSKLYRSCVNADPNYGTMWFYCREKATDDPSEILGEALEAIIHEFVATQDLYIRAVSHFVYKSIKTYFHDRSRVESVEELVCDCDQNCLCCLQDCKSVADFLVDFERGMGKTVTDTRRCDDLCAEVSCGVYFLTDFSSALIELNRSMYHFDTLCDEARRKHIFCSDQVMP